jgi:DNA repair exonuclease SbcCD ATPase subunit
MIKSLKIDNFQSHADSFLEFHPGVNIIIGGSDSGKTAIIRALRYVTTNRPSGEEFRSHWGGDTRICIETGEGKKISRIKGNDNLYDIAYAGLETKGQTFRAFGTDVPDEIQKALNLNEINLQMQLDRPFLLDSSSGEVAQHFNKIAHLDQINSGLQKVHSWIQGLKNEERAKEIQLKELELELEKFQHLEKFEIEVEVLEEQEKTLGSLQNKRTKLDQLIRSIQQIDQELEDKDQILQKESDVNALIDQIQNRDSLSQKKQDLSKIIISIRLTDTDIQELQHIIDLDGMVRELTKTVEAKEVLIERQSRLTLAIEEINKNSQRLVKMEEKLRNLEFRFKKEYPDVCPFCGSKLKKDEKK